VCAYLTVCITKCLGLLVGSIWIDRIVVISISEFRFCGLVFLTIGGIMVRMARRLGHCCNTWFVLEGHEVIGIDGLGRWLRSMSRSMCSRRNLGEEGVKHSHRNMVPRCRGSCCDHGLIIIRVIEPEDLRCIQEGAIRGYSTTIRCHGESMKYLLMTVVKCLMKGLACIYLYVFSGPVR